MRFLYKSFPDVKTISVLGAEPRQRDALIALLEKYPGGLMKSIHITPCLGGDVTLLLGLSLVDSQGKTVVTQTDQSIRAHLDSLGKPYQVLYGSLEQQLAQALRLIQPSLPKSSGSPFLPSDSTPQPQAAMWRWACDKCSDPACEHKLLTDLLARRANPS
jgi:hypothetical protein